MVQVLTSVAFVYGIQEDRILAAINAGRPDAWSCWLTRRVALLLLERVSEVLANTSSLTQRTPAPFRSEAMAFEHAAALAKTAQRMSRTPPEVLNASAAIAELVKSVALSKQDDHFRVEFSGLKGGGAAGVLARVGLQRVFQMLQDEVGKAGWLAPQAKPQLTPASEERDCLPKRH